MTAGKVKRGYQFAVIPEWVLHHPDLDAHAVRVYGVLSRFEESFPRLSYVGDRAGKISVPTVRRAIRQLEDVGACRVTPRYEGGRQISNLYELAGDSALSPVTPPPITDGTPPLSPVTPPPLSPVEGQESEKKYRENSNEKKPPAAVNGDEPETPRTIPPGNDTLKEARKIEATAIVRAWWDWHRETRGKAPLINYFAAINIVARCLESGYEIGPIKAALASLEVAPSFGSMERALARRNGSARSARTLEEIRDA